MLIFLTCLNLLLRYMKQTIRKFTHLGLNYKVRPMDLKIRVHFKEILSC